MRITDKTIQEVITENKKYYHKVATGVANPYLEGKPKQIVVLYNDIKALAYLKYPNASALVESDLKNIEKLIEEANIILGNERNLNI